MAREGPENSGGVEGGGGYSPFSREVTRLRAKEEDFRKNGGKSICRTAPTIHKISKSYDTYINFPID